MKTSKFDGIAEFERVSPELVAQAAECPAAVLCDVAGRRGALHCRIQPLSLSMKVAGPAFTVETRPGDNLMFHVALALAKPGDVIVVDGRAYESSALVGELMVAQASASRFGGFVIDGAVRDTDIIAKSSFPVFAAGRNPAGPTKNIGGRICIPISIGGVPIAPGDLIVGDCDGVVVIPKGEVSQVLVAAKAKMAAESQRLSEIADGAFVSPWLDDALRAAGVIEGHETLL